jgi:hypothetical protein
MKKVRKPRFPYDPSLHVVIVKIRVSFTLVYESYERFSHQCYHGVDEFRDKAL